MCPMRMKIKHIHKPDTIKFISVSDMKKYKRILKGTNAVTVTTSADV